MVRVRLLAAAGLGVALTGTLAHADTWSVVRHDAGRTASSQGQLFTGSPVRVWRAYLGGRPEFGAAAFRAGSTDVVVATAGRVALRNLMTQATLWESEPLGDPSVIDVVDLNGDLKLEVVVRTSPFVVVLDYSTGKALWKSSQKSFQYVATPRVRDLDGDGLLDLYVDECTGCAKAGPMSAGAYSFKNGFVAPLTLWERAMSAGLSPTNSGTDSLVDLDSDGVPEVALGSPSQMLMLSGATGNAIATLTHPTSKTFFTEASAVAAELDALPGKELVAVQTQGLAGVSGPPGLAAFRLDPKTGAWSSLWAQAPGSIDAEVVDGGDIVVDLDGDARAEVVLSFRPNAASTSWTTRVLDGATGATRAELVGARFEGAADLDGMPGAELVIAEAGGLRAHALGASGLAPKSGLFPGVRAVRWVDGSLYQNGPQARTIAVLRRPGQAAQLLVGVPTGASAAPGLPRATTFSSVTPLALAGGAWNAGTTFKPIVGEVTGAFPSGFTTRPYEQVTLGTSAGTLEVLDAAMKTTNGWVSVFGQAVGTVIGGNDLGKLGHNLIGEDNGGAFVVVPYTPFGALVGDAALAAWILPPWPRWLAPEFTSPGVVQLGSLGTAVVGVEGTSLVARAAGTGATLGTVNLGPGTPIGAPLPLRVGGAEPLVGLDWRIAGNQAVQHAINFATQSEPWAAAPVTYGGFWGSTVADLNGDGVDEWYSMYGSLFRRDTTSGAVSTFPVSTTYSLPIAGSFSQSAPELLLQSGFGGPILAKKDLSPAWVGASVEPMNAMHGTRTECPTGPLFVTPAVSSAALRAYSGKTGAIVAQRVLAGGETFSTLALAEAAGKRPGYLSHASSVASAGSGPAVLVGSSDGYLYAVDGCSLGLLWAIDMGAPVGEPTIGDYDSDGSEEIIVGTSRGYVYGIDHPALPAPLLVLLDGATGQGGIVVAPSQAVKASWPAVPGATAYEVGLMSPDEQAMWSPPYRKVDSPSLTWDLTEALAGRPYRLTVRALGSQGPSAEVSSGTIVVADETAPLAALAGQGHAKGKVSLTLTLADDLALDHYVTWWRDSTNSKRALLTDGSLGSKSASPSIEWTVPSEAWGGNIEVSVEAVDSAANVGVAKLTLDVSADGVVTVQNTAGSAGGLGSPAGSTDEPGSAGVVAGGDCSIRVVRAPNALPWLAWAAGLFALAARRRRR